MKFGKAIVTGGKSRAQPHADDLKPRECLALAVRAAFPLPKTGAFEDLLSVLDGTN